MMARSPLILLLCAMLPVWLLAGFGDWLCHRRSFIERSSGPKESLLHLLLYLLIAAPMVLALFVEVDTTLLVFATACVLVHTAVSLWDTRFAQPRRHISPLEQHIHSYLEMLPLFALTIVLLLRRDAVLLPVWELSPRQPPLPAVVTWGVTLSLVPGLLLIGEELLRCRRAARRPVTT
jgi:hypothetical protein